MDRQRMDMGRAISPPGRDRSLSPRSKELQREMQAARERRGGDRKGDCFAADHVSSDVAQLCVMVCR